MMQSHRQSHRQSQRWSVTQAVTQYSAGSIHSLQPLLALTGRPQSSAERSAPPAAASWPVPATSALSPLPVRAADYLQPDTTFVHG